MADQGADPGESNCQLDGVRVWVVEDDPEWRALVVAELEYHGACVRGFDPRRLDLTVHRLRARVRDATGAELPLRTVRGVGYILTG